MPSLTYLLQNNQDLAVTLIWEKNWQNIEVYFNDELIETLKSVEELRSGKAYLLSAEQVVEIKLKAKNRPKLEVLFEGQPVKIRARSAQTEAREAATPGFWKELASRCFIY